MDGSGDDEDDQRDDEDEGDEPPEPPPEPEDPSDDSPRITRQELEAFLVLPETRRLGMALARLKVPEQEAEGIFSDARTDALRTKQLPRAKSVQSWFSTVCRRAIARWHRKRARRKKHEGPMPVAAAVLDEAGLPIEDPGDAVVDIDASTDPTRENPVHEGMLMRRWMSGAVAGDETARVTFEILEEWMDATEDEDDDAKKNATLRALAKKRGLTEDAFYKRYQRLKETYLPRYKRWRNGMIILFLLGATLLIFVLSKVLPHKPLPPGDIRPEPSTHPVAPVPSVPVKIDPKDTEFMPAEPTQPGPKEPPRLKP